MIIPDENLNAMVEFLTEQSDTSGDHFMQAAVMLRTQRAYITALEAQAAIGRRALEVISRWPDGGSEYGQQKIKAFAKAALAGDPGRDRWR